MTITADQLAQIQQKVQTLVAARRRRREDRRLARRRRRGRAGRDGRVGAKLDESGADATANFALADLKSYVDSLALVPPAPLI